MTTITADLAPSGSLGLQVVRNPLRSIWPSRELSLAEIAKYGMAQRGLPDEVNAWRKANRLNLARGLRTVLKGRALKVPHFYGALFLTKIGPDGEPLDLGLASLRVITDTGVKFICDDFNAGAQDVSTMKFHGFGTGTSPAEGATNTGLGTELTTQYNPDSTRPTGSQASAGTTGSATYTTVATLSPDSGGTIAIVEHGVFSASSTGTLLDRSVFAAVNLVAGADSLQATYVLTVNSGS